MPGRDTAEQLLAYANSADSKWPLPQEAPILTQINTWVALREGNVDALKRVSGWNDQRRRYRHDPLAERIASAWAHYLFGEDPRVRAGDEADTDLMEELLGTDFPSELERAATLTVSEGEIWSRIYTDPLVAPRPILDWVSRSNVLPYWQGPRLAGAAVWTELAAPGHTYNGGKAIARHFEVHVHGGVLNALYIGGADNLGNRRPLDELEATSDLVEYWDFGLPLLLVDRVPNKLGRDRRVGISDYAGILDYLLDLDEAVSIGASNMRLTARQRAIISASVAASHTATQHSDLAPEDGYGDVPRARFDPSEEVFVEDPLDDELGKSRDPVRILSYDFDAQALIAWKRDLVDSAVSRVGLTPQYVGTGTGQDGYAVSGTALRLRLIPSDKTGKGKGRYWDDALPRTLRTLALIDTLPQSVGGFNRGWADPTALPVVERGPGLPNDPVEQATTHSTLVTAGLLSIETSLRERYPEWNDEAIADEVARIRDDKTNAAGAPMLGGF